ncbi:hypothetical protein ACL03H_14765 [Saccharopolyspora sp. MS10]|uniref:hypothetical protein n=1 Tax=Saccharopolyspora sp. MS10 TaxID=3385973 RepID=UPI00399F4302
MVRTGLAVAGAACLLAAGTIVSWTWGERGERSEVTALPAVAEVRLAGAVGKVEVEHRPGARAEVRERIRGGEGDGPRHRLEGGALVLPGCGDGCSIDYAITLPEPVPVLGESSAGELDVIGMASVAVRVSAGAVRVEDVAGPVRVRGTSGGIELRGLGGDVDVATGSGGISGEDLGGQVVAARTRAGSVELELTAPREVRAETGTGGVELRVPDGGYRVRAATGTGSRDVEVTTDPSSPRLLDLRTGTGSIEVEAR